MQDVVFNRTSGLWSCCWNEDTEILDCANPSNETFEALPPEQLFGLTTTSGPSPMTTTSVSVSITIAASPSTPLPETSVSASLSSTSSPSSADSQPSSSGLSTGALVGVGVGTSFGALLVLAGLIYLCTSKRKRSQSWLRPPTARDPREGHKGEQIHGPPFYSGVSELHANPQSHVNELGNFFLARPSAS